MVLGKSFILDGLMLYHPLYVLYSRYVGLMFEDSENCVEYKIVCVVCRGIYKRN